MTTTPAMPELPEPDYWSTRDDDTPLYTADQMRAYALAALQSAQPAAAGVSDADVWELWLRVCAESDNVSTRVMIANFARAILALRPQSESDEPTDEQIAAGMRELFAGPKPWPSWETTLKRVYQAMSALRPQAVPMTEADLLACVVKANCLGGVPMSNRNGHYHIDTPSDAVVRLKDAIESHHGITAPAGGEGKA